MTDHTTARTERIVLRADKAFIARLDAVARARFEGNRSFTVRQAVLDMIEAHERATKDEGQAA